jgi:hypothetical protein
MRIMAEETKEYGLESLVAGLLETIYNAPEGIPKLSASTQLRSSFCAHSWFVFSEVCMRTQSIKEELN